MNKLTEFLNRGRDGSMCPICGTKWPTYLVYDEKRVPLGCERCLMIMKEGRIQL